MNDDILAIIKMYRDRGYLTRLGDALRPRIQKAAEMTREALGGEYKHARRVKLNMLLDRCFDLCFTEDEGTEFASIKPFRIRQLGESDDDARTIEGRSIEEAIGRYLEDSPAASTVINATGAHCLVVNNQRRMFRVAS